MDMMDIRIIMLRAFKNGRLEMFIISVLLGGISALTVIAAGKIKDLSDFLILKRMCFMFIAVLILSFFILLCLLRLGAGFISRYRKSKISASQNKSGSSAEIGISGEKDSTN